MFDLSNLLSAPYKTFSLEGDGKNVVRLMLLNCLASRWCFLKGILSIEHPLSRIHFLSFTNVSCDGAEICDGLRRRKAEGLVQQQELCWLLKNAS